jgi:hypothetical protein
VCLLKILAGRARKVVKFVGQVAACGGNGLICSVGFCGVEEMGPEWGWLVCNLELLGGLHWLPQFVWMGVKVKVDLSWKEHLRDKA